MEDCLTWICEIFLFCFKWLVPIAVLLIVSSFVAYQVLQSTQSDFADRAILISVVFGVLSYFFDKFVNLFISTLKRKGKHYTFLNKVLVSLNIIQYELIYNLHLLGKMAEELKGYEIEARVNFIFNEVIPVSSPERSNFNDLLNIDILNSIESLSYRIKTTNVMLDVVKKDYKHANNLVKDHEEKNHKPIEKNSYEYERLENLIKVINGVIEGLDVIKLETNVLITILGVHAEKDKSRLDGVLTSLYFPDYRKNLNPESFEATLYKKVAKDLKLSPKECTDTINHFKFDFYNVN